jgi:hypothetical protein
VRYLSFAKWLGIAVHTQDSSGHLTHASVRWRLCACILVKNPLYKEFLLLRSQSLLMVVSYRVGDAAIEALLERRSGNAPLLTDCTLTFFNARIKISDSRLYSSLTGIHFEQVVVEKIRVDCK